MFAPHAPLSAQDAAKFTALPVQRIVWPVGSQCVLIIAQKDVMGVTEALSVLGTCIPANCALVGPPAEILINFSPIPGNSVQNALGFARDARCPFASTILRIVAFAVTSSATNAC